MAFTTPKTWSVGETLTAANFNTHIRDNLLVVPNHIPKTADQTVTSSTALVDDTHLQFAIAANEAYEFRFVLACTGPGALKVAFNAPAAAAGWWTFLRGTGGSIDTNVVIPATFVDGETKQGTTDGDVCYIDGYVLNSSTAGTFKLRWAQVSSNVTATTLKKGSWLDRRKV